MGKNKWVLATVRHGQTNFNVQKRYAGTIDVPLNDVGWADARSAAAIVSKYHFEVVISSPLRRAMETVRGLFDGRVEPVLSDLLQERNYGVMQGLTEDEIETLRPPVHFVKVARDFHSVDPVNGETLEELSVRARAFLDHLLLHYSGRDVLVVSHGQFLQQVHGVIRGHDWLRSMADPVRNLEMCMFFFEGRQFVSETMVSLVTTEQNSW